MSLEGSDDYMFITFTQHMFFISFSFMAAMPIFSLKMSTLVTSEQLQQRVSMSLSLVKYVPLVVDNQIGPVMI